MKMIMLRKVKLDQKGAAAMTIAIFMAILLSIVTIGFLRVALVEQQDASDIDLSQRAYFAAESGIEDARRAIDEANRGVLSDTDANPNNDLNADSCDPPDGYDNELSATEEYDIFYSCMIIDDQPVRLTSKLDSPNQTRQYPINPVDDSGNTNVKPDTVQIQWHFDQLESAGGDGTINNSDLHTAGSETLPPYTNWGNNPAMLEIVMLSYDESSIQRNDIAMTRFFLKPTISGEPQIRPFTNVANVQPDPVWDGRVVPVTCGENPGGYACSVNLYTNTHPAPSARKMEIRIKNHYAPTSFELNMWASPGPPSGPILRFADAQTLVDVTGRSGIVYRRIEAQLDNPPVITPDFVIQSTTDICKNFSYTDDPSDYRGQAFSSCR